MYNTLTHESMLTDTCNGKTLTDLLIESKKDGMELWVFMGFLNQFYTAESIEKIVPNYWYNLSIANS